VKIVASVCPRCGAPISVAKHHTQATCGYCQLTCAVEREKPPANLEDRKAEVVYVPQSSPILAIILMSSVALVIFVSAAGSWIGGRQTSSASTVSSAPVTASTELRFVDRPMLADANGDGHADIIGRSCVAGVMGRDFIAAFDGKTGAYLWSTAALSNDQLSLSSARAVVGDKVIVADELGVVQAFRLDSGKLAWKSKLPDKPSVICQDGNQVVIEAIDATLTGFALDSGQSKGLPEGTHCRSVYSNKDDHRPEYNVVERYHFERTGLSIKVDGMDVVRALVPAQGRVVFPLGSREKGTSVAMIAAVSDKQVLWKTLVPGIDPLQTSFSSSAAKASYAAARLVVPYAMHERSEGVRMAAFDTSTGQRLWDKEVCKNSCEMYGMASSSDTVYLATGLIVYALNLVDGTPRFHVGVE